MIGGHYMLHTPVKGYFGHGLHTFNPNALVQALEVNGFETRFVAYSSSAGAPLQRPHDADDALLWAVGRKTAPLNNFQSPQQTRWIRRYSSE